MGDRAISQEEIDLLLKGNLQEEAVPFPWQDSQEFTDMEKDAIGEIANISMGSAATTLSLLLSKKVDITTPTVKLIKAENVGEELTGEPSIMVSVDFKTGIEGFNSFILSQKDGAVIVDLMMGGDGLNPPAELDEMHISGVSEAMNQMMGSAATSMSSMFNQAVDITPPKLNMLDFPIDEDTTSRFEQQEPLVRISFRLQVENVIDSVLSQVIPLRVVRDMIETLMKTVGGNDKPSMSQESDSNLVTPVSKTEIPSRNFPQPEPVTQTRQEYNYSVPPRQETTTVQPAHFTQLKSINSGIMPENIDLILDVPLQVTVELGKAKKTIREVMNLGPGSVIELDRVAGEPVDMVVNGKLIAKCEVVVINETFGIRITDIIHPAERLKTIK